MSAIPLIRQGEDLEFTFDLGGDDITGWICEMLVKTSIASDILLVDRIIPPVGNEWPGYLTNEETSTFGIGIHLLIAKLTNASTDQKRQINKRFQVQKSLGFIPQTFFILIEGTRERIQVEGSEDRLLQET